MKAEIIIYKILSFLLLPVAGVFGIFCLISLLTAISNPPMLILVFLYACMVIYIIASFIFLTKGIDSNRPCKPTLRDWIRINGSITFVFYLLITAALVYIKLNPSVLHDVMKQVEAQNTLPPEITMEEFQSLMLSFISFFLILSVILIVHTLITFHLLQRYRYLFEPEKMDFE